MVAWWSPSYSEVAERQFQDAVQFKDLFGMVQYFGLALNPEVPLYPLYRFEETRQDFINHFRTNGFPPEFAEVLMRGMKRPGTEVVLHRLPTRPP